MNRRRFLDKSEAVRWHLDIGNVVPFGWPEHWVQILGPRIAQVHVKEYSRKVRDERGPRAGSQVDLLTGDNDWPAVMRALDAARLRWAGLREDPRSGASADPTH